MGNLGRGKSEMRNLFATVEILGKDFSYGLIIIMGRVWLWVMVVLVLLGGWVDLNRLVTAQSY